MSTAGRSSPSPRGELAVPPSPDRASAADLMQFATGDGRAAGHIGAVLLLGAAPGFIVAEARRVLGERIRAVPRLRQRLYRAPPGCGRPYWADDPAFDINEHVRQVRCPPPGDERAVLDLAAAQLRVPMPRSRPLWAATFVTGLADGGTPPPRRSEGQGRPDRPGSGHHHGRRVLRHGSWRPDHLHLTLRRGRSGLAAALTTRTDLPRLAALARRFLSRSSVSRS